LKLRFLLNFGANLIKDGIERVVNGLPEQNLCVLASLRETKTQVEPGGAGNPDKRNRDFQPMRYAIQFCESLAPQARDHSAGTRFQRWSLSLNVIRSDY
jgi:hypothetical protein